jgi:lipoyl(octanoyl) transferase
MVNDRQSLDLTTFAQPAGGAAVEWRISDGPVPYPEAVAKMESRVADIAAQRAAELVWLLEHPPLYTAGVSAKPGDLLAPDRFPVFQTGRGGQFTYHGPGQRVAYVMFDLRKRGRDVTRFVADLESWLIGALAHFNVKGEVREGRVGVWVERKGPTWSREDKIAAIGVRLRKWVSFHGIAFNVEPDLEHFSGITPCGVSGPQYGVTSLADLGLAVTMSEYMAAARSPPRRARSGLAASATLLIPIVVGTARLSGTLRPEAYQPLADYFAKNPKVKTKDAIISRRFIKPDVVVHELTLVAWESPATATPLPSAWASSCTFCGAICRSSTSSRTTASTA